MNGTLNNNIKNFRKFKGMTQEELATKVEKSKNVISNWERGDNSPDIDSVEKICNALGVTPNQLFGWEPYPEYERFISIMREKRKILAKLEEKRDGIQQQIDGLYTSIKEEEDRWRDTQ